MEQTMNMINILVDTDVIIDYLKGYHLAKSFLSHKYKNRYISAMTIAELFVGVRNEQEQAMLEVLLSSFEVVNIDKKIAAIGGMYRKQYGKTHGVGLADAIIAASAESIDAQLVTLNKKHYPMFSNLIVPYNK